MQEHRIGQVGLGVIGRLYAGHLKRAFDQLVIFDLDPEAVELAAQQGATPASSAKGLAAQCDRIILSLPSPSAVEAAMVGPDGILEGAAAGTVVLDLSTIDPFTSRRIYAAAREKGVSYLDSPVSGGAPGGAGTDGARAATISFMVGGDKDAFEEMKPYMEVIGKRFFFLGPAGSGSTAKLISNLVAGLHNLIDAEAFVLAAAAGIPPQTLLDVFDGTDAKSFWLTDYFAPRILRKDFEPGFSVDLQYKDHRLAGELAQQLKVPLLFNQLAVQVYQMMRSQGLGSKDLVEAVNFLGGLSGADIYNPREPQA
jgi:3-hydroxyisobutyrate dehydrogenase-like beta-hydroxyacid dehydrogenase